jgi:predicted XRE-type DNA-binding protein
MRTTGVQNPHMFFKHVGVLHNFNQQAARIPSKYIDPFRILQQSVKVLCRKAFSFFRKNKLFNFQLIADAHVALFKKIRRYQATMIFLS